MLVVGPSGAGKDTLIDHARRVLAADGVTAMRRVVTRPPTLDELHDSLDPAAFAEAAARGAFAVRWQAHGLDYALPASLDRQLAQGRTILCNVSRGVVGTLRVRYPGTWVVYVDAPLAVRQARIAGRKRIGEAAERAFREQPFRREDADRVVDNGDSLDAACHAFIAAVRAAPSPS